MTKPQTPKIFYCPQCTKKTQFEYCYDLPYRRAGHIEDIPFYICGNNKCEAQVALSTLERYNSALEKLALEKLLEEKNK